MKHFLASAMLGAMMVGSMPGLVVPAYADTPADQLVVAFSMNNVLTMDPAAITGRETVQILNNVYDTLVALDPETRALTPRVAKSWTIAPDNMSVTFALRDDVSFASGNPLTAEDVVYSLKRLLKLNLAQATPLKSRGYTDDNADQMFVAVDAHTFRLGLPQADDPKLILMNLALAGPGSILDSKLVAEHETNGDMGAAWLTNNSAGSGAYTLDQWRSNEFVILKRNDAYWGEKPAMVRVLMRHLPESQTQRLGLEKGDLDVAYSLAAPDLKALSQEDGVKVETVSGAGFYYLAMSMKDEHFQNPKVREALRYLIDYKGIDEAIMPFFGKLHQQPINSGAIGLKADPGYTLDVEKAKQLLAEAGYPDGFETTLRVISEQQFRDAATSIQNTLAQAGIKAEIITGDGGTIYGAMRDRDFNLIVGRGGGGQLPHPDSNLRALAYNPDNSDEAKLTNYQGWRTSFYDETLNQMIEDALIEGDQAKQAKLYGDIQDYMQKIELPFIPFAEVVDTAAYRANVHGLIVSPWLTRFEAVTKSSD